MNEHVEKQRQRTGLSACAHNKSFGSPAPSPDLEVADNIEVHHLAEAINYRMLDRDIWL